MKNGKLVDRVWNPSRIPFWSMAPFSGSNKKGEKKFRNNFLHYCCFHRQVAFVGNQLNCRKKVVFGVLRGPYLLDFQPKTADFTVREKIDIFSVSFGKGCFLMSLVKRSSLL